MTVFQRQNFENCYPSIYFLVKSCFMEIRALPPVIPKVVSVFINILTVFSKSFILVALQLNPTSKINVSAKIVCLYILRRGYTVKYFFQTIS